MKTLYLTENSYNIVVDTEDNSVDRLESLSRYDIRDIYFIKEPMHIVYGFAGKKEELDVQPNDILLLLYDRPYTDTHLVVVNNKIWADVLDAKLTAEQKEKEEWAAKAKNLKDCACCECCETSN